MPESAPPRFPPPPPLPAKQRLFQRTPPAVFPAILGLYGLGLAWRKGADAFGVPGGIVEAFLGGVTLLFAFSLAAYAVKVIRRPTVWIDDLQILPGRAGLAAMTMCVMLLAATLVPYTKDIAAPVLWTGFAGHGIVGLAVLAGLVRRVRGGTPIAPTLHLVFVGFIVAPAGALPMGYGDMVPVLAWYALIMSVVVCTFTLGPLIVASGTPPLRPLHAVHLAPPALIATATLSTGQTLLADAMMVWASLLFVLLAVRTRWMVEAGVASTWSAFTFPVAGFAGMWFVAADVRGWAWAETAGGLILILATLITPPIALRVMRFWADGSLAERTNAASA